MKHLDNNELGDRLQLVMNFIFVYSRGQILSPIFLHNLVKINLPYPLPKATTFRAHSNGNPREPEREENPYNNK